MAENKTKLSETDVADYFSAITDDVSRTDCAALAKLMARATQEPPRMWGTSIVGFGSYHYKYESGREGDSCVVGFSSRKSDIAIYIFADFPGRDALLGMLGKHRLGKGCLYIRRLDEVDHKALEKVIAASFAERKRHYSQ
jgi:hypothetical protein